MAELSSNNKSDNETNDKSNQETQCLSANNVNNDKSYNLNNDESDNLNNDKSDNINDDKSNKTNNNKNDCNPRETIRRQFYKHRIRRDNFKLELDDRTPQEERRRLLLEYQKKHRDETFNDARGILQEFGTTSKNEEEENYIGKEEYMDAEEHMDEEYMEIEEYASSYYKISPNESKTSRMMLSEWMLDVPQDFTENWIMVPCPVGKRVRLISGWGETKAYSRKGDLHGVFPSALPGGNPDGDFHHSAAVDCLWIKNRKLFYILDVLYWSLLPFTNCQAEFRFFWINNINSALTNLDGEQPLDGLLFYHREALYTYGLTPLVTWLKPFMLSEVLGISVPSPFDEKPDNYISFEHHVQRVKFKKNLRDITKSDTNSMEIEAIV
ncbi:PREDICTED: snurportin-1 [Cyphomyrmex costatus]|uniref:snurportin-1 n=1 Tax=Cyphomyrmex costatus TaxID=456900 RepID=UPI0008523A71|nr:PREDICTED: snurportin-1 [Cyphomyrmex costatus]